jgi:hypothetical protein
MNNQFLVLIGLIFNLAGALFLGFSFIYKNQKANEPGLRELIIGPRRLKIGKKKYSYTMIGIILVAIGALLQIITIF